MGSDHFPILVELGLNDKDMTHNEEEQMEADAGEVAVADEKITKGQ